MKIITTFVAIVFCVSLAAGQTGQRKVADFPRMAGCWEIRDEARKRVVSEYWMKPEGTSILGIGRTVTSGKTTDFEAMRIEERAEGIFFVARPSSKKEDTSFKLKTSTMNEFVFENSDNDFPNRVIYKLGSTTLHARIEGTDSGKPMGIDFPMTRVKCESK